MNAFINSNSEFFLIGKKFWLYHQFMAKSNDNLCSLFVANISSFDATQKRISPNVPNVNCNHIAIQNTFLVFGKSRFKKEKKNTHHFRKHIMKTILWIRRKLEHAKNLLNSSQSMVKRCSLGEKQISKWMRIEFVKGFVATPHW